ncbi:MAG TPA: hypothetical protein PKK48_05470 [Phycisphaerae bacterium]|nr:hypothetical protein [Phycisphaerae bacterium]
MPESLDRLPEPLPQQKPRNRIWSFLHDFLWVALVTLLIWIYADMEFTDIAKYKATLTLNTTGTRDVALISPSEYPIEFELSGNQGQLQEFQRALTANGSIINVDVSQGYPLGEAVVSIPEMLEKTLRLREQGLQLKNVEPKAATLHLDTLKKLTDVTVELDAFGATHEITSTPVKMDVYVPSTRWETLQKALGREKPKLRTKLFDLKDYQPGKHYIEADIIPIIAGVPVIPDKPQTGFDVSVINPIETKTVTVSVGLLTPAAWDTADDSTWKEYVLVQQTPAQWRPMIKISGAGKDLATTNIQAFIQLTEDDKKPIESWIERDVIVNFPPELNLQLASPAPKLKFRLEKRKINPDLVAP